MKTKQELENIKEEIENLNTELRELSDEELEQVTGGATEAMLARMGELDFNPDIVSKIGLGLEKEFILDPKPTSGVKTAVKHFLEDTIEAEFNLDINPQ